MNGMITTGQARELYDKYYIGESRPTAWVAEQGGISVASLAECWLNMNLRLRDRSESQIARKQLGQPWSWGDEPATNIVEQQEEKKMGLLEILETLDEEQFLSEYEAVMKEHSYLRKTPRNVATKEEMTRRYPWFAEVRQAAMNNSTPEGKASSILIGRAGQISRKIPYGNGRQPRQHKNGKGVLQNKLFGPLVEHQQETAQPQEPTNGKKGPSPSVTVKAWLDEHGELRATYQELAHFTGYTDAAFSGVVRKMEGEGYVFDRAGGALRVVSRPDSKHKQEMKQEIAILEGMLRELKAKMDKM